MIEFFTDIIDDLGTYSSRFQSVFNHCDQCQNSVHALRHIHLIRFAIQVTFFDGYDSPVRKLSYSYFVNWIPSTAEIPDYSLS